MLHNKEFEKTLSCNVAGEVPQLLACSISNEI